MTRVFEVQAIVDVTITVNDDGAITRCVENWDEEGRPSTTGDGWRDKFYPLVREEQIIEMWAFNAVINDVEDVERLDGWADLPRGTVTMDVSRSMEIADVREVTPA